MAENRGTGLSAERENRIRKIRKRRKAILLSGVIIVLLLIIVILLFALLFRVRSYKIKFTGDVPYSEEEISSALVSFNGRSLFTVGTDDIAPILESNLPYIGEATVLRKLPCTLQITVSPAIEFYAVEVNTGLYAITDGNLKVLKVDSKIPDGTALVQGRKSSDGYEIGSRLSFSSDVGDDVIQAALSDIAAEAANSGLENISMIDVSSSDSIYMIYDGRIIIRLGNTTNMTSKISLAKKSIDEENETSPKGYGELNVTISGKAVFAPKDYKDIEELALYEEKINPATLPEEETQTDTEADADTEVTDEATDEAAEGETEDITEEVTEEVTDEVQYQ